MPNFNLLYNLLLVMSSAFIGGLVSKKLKQPLIFGYLLAGLVVSGLAGILVLGLDRRGLSVLAEIGLALLMFTLGLEFSLKKIEKFKATVELGAGLQIILTILIGTFLLKFIFGFTSNTAFIMACSFSLSSTAIVIKVLSEKAGLESLPGEIMLGWLLIQDLAVLPLITLFPILFAASGLSQNLFSLVKALAIVLIAWYGAKKVISGFTDFVASFESRELLLIFVVCLVFIMATITFKLGFSLGLGAFLAGLILSRATSHFAIFSEIRPLRDVFLAVFFVSLGLSLEPSFLILNIGKIFTISLFVLTFKIVLIAIILSFFHHHAKTIIESSFGLSQVGEFSFVLASTALAANFLNRNEYSLVVSATLLTMVCTPWLISFSETLYKKVSLIAPRFPNFYKHFFTQEDRLLPFKELPFENHVVILGYGRVGKWVGEALRKAKIPFLVVEYNPQTVRRLKLEENSVIFGDPSDINVLDFAQVDKAKLVILAIPDPLTQKIVIANCQALNPKVKIICRSHSEDNEDLKAMGIDNIIQPEFEAALSIAHRAFQSFGFDKENVDETIKKIKREHEQ